MNRTLRHCYYKQLLFMALLFVTKTSLAQVKDSLFLHLKKLSIEELMDLQVSSVSKHSEMLITAASAIQVITQKHIRSSGARTVPEALRLATNLQVAQVNASQWAISARGFNNVLANKLLVLIDGRTVYTPLYAGVFWDVQNLVLEDVDRIEVISGPGGALWGANAVNGVINIITKSAKDTKGLFVEAASGSNMPGLGSVRYGNKLSDKMSYRIYGTGFKIGNTLLANGKKADDNWAMGQGGLQFNWDASVKDKVMIQTNVYSGKPNPDGGDTAVIAKGDNVLARWNHKSSEKSEFQMQVYYDHTWRDFGNKFTENLKTYDLELQHHYQVNSKHSLTYGANVRLMEHQVTNLQLFAFKPEHKTLSLYSAFLQDEITLIKERLRLTVGGKIEHNSYTGFEYQPNGRLTWTAAKNHTIWASASRAVRTPARIDREFFLYLTPTLPFITGNDSLRSENVIAYELGWRSQPLENLSFSASAFYNVYDNLRSVEPGPPPFNIPVVFANGVKGNTYGFELSATHQLTDWWNLRGGYTFLKKKLSVKPGSKDLNGANAESNDPENQFLLQSTIELPAGLQLGTVIRYVSKLPRPKIADYTAVDFRIGWQLNKIFELSVVGQNLLDDRHTEFIPSSPSSRQMERSVYGKITCRF